MLDEKQAVDVAKELLPKLYQERARLTTLDNWYRWKQADLTLPKTATKELKALQDLAKTPWLWLVVTTLAQAMFVDDYRSSNSNETSPQWTTWLANGMDVRQIAIHRAALAYGYSYAVVMPGIDDLGRKQSVIRGVSPRKAFAVYEDPAEDEWPVYMLRDDAGGKLRLIDDQVVHKLQRVGDGEIKHVGFDWHFADRCPVIRYANDLDLEGRATGQVEPFIGVASRINKTTYDRLQTQHFNSWKVRTVSGMAEPETDTEKARAELLLRQKDLLIAEDPDTKFGTLDETPLDGFIAATESDIEALSATSQTPSYALTGKLVNLNAEALVAARHPLTQKVFEIRTSFGGSHNRTMRMSAWFEEDYEIATDVSASVKWQDLEARSLSQAVDAYGKAAKLLGVPVQALWGRIPGVSKTDVAEWKQIALESDSYAQYLRDQFGPDSSADSLLGV
ncbi:phage portal protein [Rhodococcus qingshengii]|uniref:phage portal protein n=1 Tax=Rhodococcus qingshengii TaxID=334542 RepID=UPI0010A6744E|nr:phage portal protein [Rhodococcus qingshengii]THJ69133.1 phage portal protein [Rhodococcus qingshengii]